MDMKGKTVRQSRCYFVCMCGVVREVHDLCQQCALPISPAKLLKYYYYEGKNDEEVPKSKTTEDYLTMLRIVAVVQHVKRNI